MIHDAQDGGAGRRVWEIRLPKPVFVIAADAHAARAWLRSVLDATELPPGPLAVVDRGSADRTEIALWHDETRLPTDTAGGGSAP